MVDTSRAEVSKVARVKGVVCTLLRTIWSLIFTLTTDKETLDFY